jgi:3'-5' exoribonuclease
MAATPEAVFVSMIDNLDAKMGMVQAVLRKRQPGEVLADYHPGLQATLLTEPPYPESGDKPNGDNSGQPDPDG